MNWIIILLLNTMYIIGASSIYGHKSEQLVGAEMQVDEELTNISDPLIREALSHVTDRYNAMSNSMYRVIPTGGKVTRQTVNGIIFKFTDLEFRQTTCRNNEKAKGKFTKEDCPLDDKSNLKGKKANAEVFWNRETFQVNQLELTD